jgi:carboxypeptidase Taq
MSIEKLFTAISTVNDLLNAASVLTWDSRTMMPAGGASSRGSQIATLMVLAQERLISTETRHALDGAEVETANLPSDDANRQAVAAIRHAVSHHLRIPADLLRRKAELRTSAQAIWVQARADKDFSAFAPALEQTVALQRETAEAMGYEAHPYDAMLMQYEPGETAASLRTLFASLRAGIAPLLGAVQSAQDPASHFLHRHFPEQAQRGFALTLADRIGYDLQRGRLDKTIHPFEVSFTRNDVRITTKYREDYLPPALFGTLHEAGHGIYEQNISPDFTRTVFATDLVGLYAVGGTSYGAHESQSRLYENHIGRSRVFWQHHFAALQAAFPEALRDVDADSFHRAVNRVRPGFIRIEADELTYDLHIMLRVELEIRLMDGSLRVADLPEAWSAGMKSSLGLDVPDAAQGPLQDIHWSSGTIGSFCSYTIGNIMAAQLMQAMRTDRPEVSTAIQAGDYLPLRTWLTENVHQHGRRHSRDVLLTRATGRPLDVAPYLAYLNTKYREIYTLA